MRAKWGFDGPTLCILNPYYATYENGRNKTVAALLVCMRMWGEVGGVGGVGQRITFSTRRWPTKMRWRFFAATPALWTSFLVFPGAS